MRTKHLFIIGTLVAVSLAAPGIAAPPDNQGEYNDPQSNNSGMQENQTQSSSSSATENSQDWSLLKARNIMHMALQNNQGEKLGSVSDLLVDWKSGTVPYAVISSGGFLGMGSTYRVVPVTSLSQYPGKNDTFALNINKDRWNGAPSFSKDKLTGITADASRNIDQFYGSTVTARNIPSDVPTPTGRESGEMAGGGSLQLASDVIGKQVVNRQDENLGKISDLLVDVKSGQPTFAILSSGGVLKGGDQYALPLKTLNSGGSNKNQLIVDANTKLFEDAQTFDRQKAMGIGSGTSSQVFRFNDSAWGTHDKGTTGGSNEPSNRGTPDTGTPGTY